MEVPPVRQCYGAGFRTEEATSAWCTNDRSTTRYCADADAAEHPTGATDVQSSAPGSRK